jgi:tetratricopeptide (TPR) repeat protein
VRRPLALAAASLLLACRAESPAPTQVPASAPPSGAASTRPPSATALPTAPAPPTPETLAEGTPTQLAALNGAKAALAAGKDREALALFREAMEGGMTGTSVSAALAAAELLSARGRDAEALELYRQLVVRAQLIPEVQFTAARFFWTHGDDKGAQAALENALVVQPDFLPAWRLLGMAQARAGKKTEAGRTLTEYELRLGRIVRRSADLGVPAGERLGALVLLSMLDDDRGVEALVKALKDPDAGLRAAVAEMLADENAPEALAGLASAALAEKDPDVRLHIATQLARARAHARAETASPLPGLPRPAVAPSSGAP